MSKLRAWSKYICHLLLESTMYIEVSTMLNSSEFYVQVIKFNKYKCWNPKVRLCIVIVLSCFLISC